MRQSAKVILSVQVNKWQNKQTFADLWVIKTNLSFSLTASAFTSGQVKQPILDGILHNFRRQIKGRNVSKTISIHSYSSFDQIVTAPRRFLGQKSVGCVCQLVFCRMLFYFVKYKLTLASGKRSYLYYVLVMRRNAQALAKIILITLISKLHQLQLPTY